MLIKEVLTLANFPIPPAERGNIGKSEILSNNMQGKLNIYTNGIID